MISNKRKKVRDIKIFIYIITLNVIIFIDNVITCGILYNNLDLCLKIKC